MDKNNISEKDAWNILVDEGLDKLLGITEDEFSLINSLNSSNSDISEKEISSILSAYRAYKKYRNPSSNMIKSS